MNEVRAKGLLIKAGAPVLIWFALIGAGCGQDGDDEIGESTAQEARAAAAMHHVHGLGINPADGALYIATHTGLFRSPRGSDEVARVGESTQDIMGFTIVGPDHFIGSGHPAPDKSGPHSLGLISSKNAGRSWSTTSLRGEADFHVLRYMGGQVYGYNGLTGELLVSSDLGQSWTSRRPPAPLVDLAVNPEDFSQVLASTPLGLEWSQEAGKRWDTRAREAGLLAWPTGTRLYLLTGLGDLRVSADAGRTWRGVGRLDGEPTAFAAAGDRELYVALADGRVLWSSDGGVSWRTRVATSLTTAPRG